MLWMVDRRMKAACSLPSLPPPPPMSELLLPMPMLLLDAILTGVLQQTMQPLPMLTLRVWLGRLARDASQRRKSVRDHGNCSRSHPCGRPCRLPWNVPLLAGLLGLQGTQWSSSSRSAKTAL